MAFEKKDSHEGEDKAHTKGAKSTDNKDMKEQWPKKEQPIEEKVPGGKHKAGCKCDKCEKKHEMAKKMK